jgi:DNA-binding IclR family transcriptional regulator
LDRLGETVFDPRRAFLEAAATSVEKAVDLLFHLRDVAEPQGVTAIGRALGLPKSSAHRMLRSLGRRGLVERDERGRYRPGMGLLALGLGIVDREPIAAAARPVLEAQALALGETFFLVVARAGELVVLDKAEGTGFLRAAPQVGSRVPVHATAAGKLYLAFAPDQIAVAPRPGEGSALPSFTRQTAVDSQALEAEVRRVRGRGWASNRDEWISGLSVLAAPVLRRGRVAGVVALGAASANFEALGGERLSEQVALAAGTIAERLAGGEERQ